MKKLLAPLLLFAGLLCAVAWVIAMYALFGSFLPQQHFLAITWAIALDILLFFTLLAFFSARPELPLPAATTIGIASAFGLYVVVSLGTCIVWVMVFPQSASFKLIAALCVELLLLLAMVVFLVISGLVQRQSHVGAEISRSNVDGLLDLCDAARRNCAAAGLGMEGDFQDLRRRIRYSEPLRNRPADAEELTRFLLGILTGLEAGQKPDPTELAIALKSHAERL